MTLFLLLVAFQFKHFFADYPLQIEYHLGKFKTGWSWVAPLASHCFVHMLFTFLIVMWFAQDSVWAFKMATFDFVSHFIMDRIKASPRWLGRFKPLTSSQWMTAKRNFNNQALRSNRWFWISIGIDQLVHHLTDLVIVFLTILKWLQA